MKQFPTQKVLPSLLWGSFLSPLSYFPTATGMGNDHKNDCISLAIAPPLKQGEDSQINPHRPGVGLHPVSEFEALDMQAACFYLHHYVHTGPT